MLLTPTVSLEARDGQTITSIRTEMARRLYVLHATVISSAPPLSFRAQPGICSL